MPKKEQFFTESQNKIFEIARKGGQGLAVLLKKLLNKMETENGGQLREDFLKEKRCRRDKNMGWSGSC